MAVIGSTSMREHDFVSNRIETSTNWCMMHLLWRVSIRFGDASNEMYHTRAPSELVNATRPQS